MTFSAARLTKRRLLFRLQKGICHYCECEMTLDVNRPNTCTVDHKKPQARGGWDRFSNLVAACWSCNNAKGSMAYGDFMILVERGLVHRREPGDVPGRMVYFVRPRKSVVDEVREMDAPWTRKVRPAMPDEPRATAKLGEFFPPELMAMVKK